MRATSITVPTPSRASDPARLRISCGTSMIASTGTHAMVATSQVLPKRRQGDTEVGGMELVNRSREQRNAHGAVFGFLLGEHAEAQLLVEGD